MSQDNDPSSMYRTIGPKPLSAYASPDHLLEALVNSGVLEQSGASNLWESLAPRSRPQSAAELAALLVEQGQLTPYQAAETLAGRIHELTFSDYVILGRIGAGGMGQVFQAHHRRMDRIVALKQIGAKLIADEAAVKRFQREVKAAAKLSHPNIVAAYDAGEIRGQHFLVLEYVAGTDLWGLVKQRGPLSVPQAVDCTLQTAKGLAYAHSKGVIHRDVKPANLLLDPTGTVKVLDMGLAHLDDANDGLTGTQQVMGTADYMSPEQMHDSKHVDGRADIYSLGCTLWFLLTGASVYQGDTLVQRILRHREAPIPSLIERCPAAPPELDALFRRMVAKQASDRPESMASVAKELSAIHAKLAASEPNPPLAAEQPLGESLSGLVSAPAASPTTSIRDSGETTNANQGRSRSAPVAAAPPVVPQSVGQRGNNRGNRRKLLAAAGAAAVILLAGIIVYVKNKNGEVVAKIEVPEGGSVTIQDKAIPGQSGLPAATWKAGPDADVLPGIVSRPAKLKGIGRWNVETKASRSKGGAISLRPDGKQIAYRGPVIRICDFESGELKRILPMKGGMVWSPDGARFATGDGGRTIRFFDAVNGHQTAVFEAPSGQLWPASWSRDGQWLAYTNSYGVDVLPVCRADGKPGPEIKGLGTTRAAAFCQKADWLATISYDDRKIRVWDSNFKLHFTTDAQSSQVNSVSWQPEGKWLAAGYGERHLRIWNTEDGKRLADLIVGNSFINAVAVSPDGAWVAVSSQDCHLYFVATKDWSVKYDDLYSNERWGFFYDAHWLPDSSGVVFQASKGCGQANIVGTRSVHELGEPSPWLQPGWAPLAVSRDGTLFASVDSDGVRIRRTADATLQGFISNPSGDIRNVAWNRDGSQLVSNGTKGPSERSVRMWDARSGKQVRRRNFSEPFPAAAVDWSPDGRWIVAADIKDNKIVCRVWNADNEDDGRELFMGAEGSEGCGVAWSPDAKRLALYAGRKIHVASTDNWAEVWTSDPIEQHAELAWSPDSRQILVKPTPDGDNDRVAIFDLKDSKPAHEFSEPIFYQAAWNSTQDRLAIAEKRASKLKLLNAADFSLVREINYPTAWLAWLPHQPRLLGGDDGDSTTVLWNTDNGQPEWTSTLLPNNQMAVFNSAGQLLPSSTPGAEDQLVYMIERDDGTLELLSFAEFSRRFPDAKLSAAADVGKSVAAPLATADKPWNTPAFKQWMEGVAAMPAEKQVEAVAKELQELNPGFDGKLTGRAMKGPPTIENGVVTEIGFFTNDIIDISPVRALTRLTHLEIGGRGQWSKLADLRPLQGMSLHSLGCSLTQISDLSPLKGMPLTGLACGETRVADLSALRGMKLEWLHCDYTDVYDVSPLKGMLLTELYCESTKIYNLTPLEEMSLTEFVFTPKNITKGMEIIRQMKSLKTLGIDFRGGVKWPPAEFWKKYDAGEFGKPGAETGVGKRVGN